VVCGNTASVVGAEEAGVLARWGIGELFVEEPRAACDLRPRCAHGAERRLIGSRATSSARRTTSRVGGRALAHSTHGEPRRRPRDRAQRHAARRGAGGKLGQSGARRAASHAARA